MLRIVLEMLLVGFLARAFWRVVDGVVDGMKGSPQRGVPPSAVPQRGVRMVRDPVCGTFVVPQQALSMADGSTQVFFCSTSCRDAYRADRRGRRSA